MYVYIVRSKQFAITLSLLQMKFVIFVTSEGAIVKVYQCAYEDNCTNDKYAMKIMELKKSDDIDAFNNQEPRFVSFNLLLQSYFFFSMTFICFHILGRSL